MGAKTGAKKEEKAAKPTQITVILRLAAGGYLVYLAFGLLQEFLKPAGGGKMVQPVSYTHLTLPTNREV